MKRAIHFVSGIVLAHVLVNIFHGAAHLKLHIELDPGAMLFVIAVILVCPLVALALLWTSQQRFGLLLLGFSMLASLIFGFYKHFVAMSPDHVGQQAPGPWGAAFAATAYLLLVTETVGTFIGLYFLYRGRATHS